MGLSESPWVAPTEEQTQARKRLSGAAIVQLALVFTARLNYVAKDDLEQPLIISDETTKFNPHVLQQVFPSELIKRAALCLRCRGFAYSFPMTLAYTASGSHGCCSSDS
jgi:hypothetical protein